jgi:hypothetical protein
MRSLVKTALPDGEVIDGEGEDVEGGLSDGLLPGVVPIWAKAAGVNSRPTNEITVTTVISVFIAYLPV